MCTDTIEQVVCNEVEAQKCCENCAYFNGHICCSCDAPFIEFDGVYGDPATFWCSLWKEKAALEECEK